ncbi:MAG TPA: CAP domain-containing protein [Acidimicrobiales bacterium]|nr:CAP domain-containing protein [Acidimicrobiales bacterium]
MSTSRAVESPVRRRFQAAVVGMAIVLAALVLPAHRASADQTFDQRMLTLLNQDRAANGLAPLVADPTLGANAEDAPYLGCGFTVLGRATDMGVRNYFSHTILGCLTQTVFNILGSTGLVYSGAGENIAWANALTDPLVAAANLENQLMNSPDHRANILNPNYTKVGIGSWHTSPGQTWSGGGYALGNVYIGVQIFAGGPVTTTTTPTTVAPTTTTTLPTAPSPGAGFHALTPARILDTRFGTGAPTAPIGAGGSLNLQVTGRGGVPATGVSAVVLNVTVTQPTAASYLTVYPTGEAMPLAANLNFVPGQTVPNLVTAKVGANGQVTIFNGAGTTQVVADVAGWFDVG